MTLLREMIISQLELRPLRFNLNKWNGIANSEGKTNLELCFIYTVKSVACLNLLAYKDQPEHLTLKGSLNYESKRNYSCVFDRII